MKAIILTEQDGSKLCIGTDNFVAAEKDRDDEGTIVYFTSMEEGDYERTVIETPEEIAKQINNL